VSGKL